MTSRVTTVYDQIVSVLGTLLSAHTRIPYAYDLEKNNDNFLRKGYGLKVGSSTRNDLEICHMTFDRTFTVVVTREVFNLDSNETGYDTIIKDLMEDIFTVQSRFFETDDLGISADIVKIDPTDQSAIEEVNAQNSTFLSMEASFIFTIKEDIGA